MSIFSLRASVLACALLLFSSGMVRAGELLEWKDATGKFSVKAEFVELTDKELKLKREGGAELKIPLEKLSPESIAQAKKLASPDTAAPIPEVKPANPYNIPKLLIPDWSKAVRIDFDKLDKANSSSEQTVSVPWKFVYKSRLGVQYPKPAYSKIIVPRYKRENKVVGSSDAVFLSENHAAGGVVCESLDDYKNPATVMHRLNLSNGKLEQSHVWKEYYLPLAYHASTKSLLVKSKKTFNNIEVVEVWQLTENAIVRKVMWDVFETSTESNSEITEAYFLDENRVLIAYDRGVVSIWNINTGTALCKISQGIHGSRTAISVDVEQAVLAYNGARRVYLISLTNYQIIGELPEEYSYVKLAFSPSGKQLAIFKSNDLHIWDLESQKKSVDASSRSETLGSREKVTWLSDKHVLTGETLYDTELMHDLWKYKDINNVYIQGEFCVCLPKTDRFSANPAETINLSVHQFPHPEALAAYENFAPPPPAYYLVPGPDAKIAIDVSGIDDASIQQPALQAMTKQLTGYGYQIADDAVFKLVATASHSENYKREFRRTGSSNTVIVDYRYHTTTLKMSLGKNVIWQANRSTGGIGNFLSDKQLEDFQKNALNPTPNYDLFLKPKLPEKIEKAVEKNYQPGTWKLTENGFVPEAK